MQNELNILKSIKFLKNIVKINIDRNFIVKNNLKIKNSGPIDSATTHKLKQLLFQNNSACDNAVKNFISKTATMAEAIKISKEKFSVFFSKPSETKNSNRNKSDTPNNLAILAKFENSIKNTIINSILISIQNLPYTIIMVIVNLIPIIYNSKNVK